MCNIDPRYNRYMSARILMSDKEIPIPPQILREYLDFMREFRVSETSEYFAKRLIVTGQWLRPTGLVSIIFGQAIKKGYIIVSSGDDWEKEI